MFNIMLDRLPDHWNGYPIDTDFRTGIQISQCLADETLSDMESNITAVELLFPDEEQTPPYEEAAEAIKWFLTEYNHDNHTGKNKESVIFDFDIDQWRIYAAFLSQYHIDLNTVQMHWFTFMGLLSNISECSLTNVMDIRQKKITSKMSNEEKRAIKESKEIFKLKPQEEKLSPEEQEAVSNFMKYANIST